MSVTLSKTPRKAGTQVLDLTVDNVRQDDILVGKRGGERFTVVHAATRSGITRITVLPVVFGGAEYQRTYELPHTHLVRVLAEHECDCNGTGMFSRGMHNGKPVNAGTHYRCQGKGFQTRRDVQRNSTHDNNCRSCTGT